MLSRGVSPLKQTDAVLSGVLPVRMGTHMNTLDAKWLELMGCRQAGRAHQALNYPSVVMAGDLLMCTKAHALARTKAWTWRHTQACTRAHNRLTGPVKDDERPVTGIAGFGTGGQKGYSGGEPTPQLLLNDLGF